MGKIKVLDDKTINQIAAGEVIENPASVIKELVENARDAGARTIRVETKAAGRAWIQVSDDGHGMDAQDLRLSVERHATSKIAHAHDLFQIQSLGFRGEALASIASVSKMQVHSSEGDGGHLLTVSGGHIENFVPRSRQRGTTVDVRQLFYNIPVRRAFQKSMASDTAEIHKTLAKFALSIQGLGLTWVHDGETRFELLPSYDLLTRVAHVLGQEYASELIVLDKIGCIGKPTAHRPHRIGQYLAINGRAITSPWIAQMVLKSYGTSLPSGRFPIFVLQLDMPTQWVDVNVHPQKHEVRLQEQDQIAEQLKTSIEKALQPQQLPFSMISARSNDFLMAPRSVYYKEAAYQERCLTDTSTKIIPPTVYEVDCNLDKLINVEQNCEPDLPGYVASLKAVAVVAHYLILETPEGMQFMDLRRALHRIRFERMLRMKTCETQALLIPKTIEVEEEEKVFLLENMATIHQQGIHIRHFGGLTFVIEALPDWISLEQIADVVRQIIQNGIESCMRIVSRCHMQRAYLLEEAKAILEQLQQCTSSTTTPEGGAIFVDLTLKEIHAKFQKT